MIYRLLGNTNNRNKGTEAAAVTIWVPLAGYTRWSQTKVCNTHV